MYFRLLPEVYLIIGKKKSLLQNILNKKCLLIDNDLSCLLKESEENKTIPIGYKEIFKSLSDNNWGILSENPIFIDKFRLTNIFNDKRFFKDVPYISSAILKITDKCNLSCYTCGKMFCPVCFKSDNASNCMDLNDWEKIINNLSKFGCNHIILTGGECTLYPKLKSLCDFIYNLNIALTISTNGINPIEVKEYNENLSILIPLFDNNNVDKIIKNYKDFRNITLVVCCQLENQEMFAFPSQWTIVSSSVCEPIINKNNMINTDIFNFFLRKDRNKCLNGKIAILENGDVYPCLGACVSSIKLETRCKNYDFDPEVLNNKKIGNVLNDEWPAIIKKLIKNYWNNKIDYDIICMSCEFRYACDKCLFNDPKQNCQYILEEARWK